MSGKPAFSPFRDCVLLTDMSDDWALAKIIESNEQIIVHNAWSNTFGTWRFEAKAGAKLRACYTDERWVVWQMSYEQTTVRDDELTED